MAELKAAITITGIDFAQKVIKGFMGEAVFNENVSEDYKRGFYDFGFALISALENMVEKYGD